MLLANLMALLLSAGLSLALRQIILALCISTAITELASVNGDLAAVSVQCTSALQMGSQLCPGNHGDILALAGAANFVMSQHGLVPYAGTGATASLQASMQQAVPGTSAAAGQAGMQQASTGAGASCGQAGMQQAGTPSGQVGMPHGTQQASTGAAAGQAGTQHGMQQAVAGAGTAAGQVGTQHGTPQASTDAAGGATIAGPHGMQHAGTPSGQVGTPQASTGTAAGQVGMQQPVAGTSGSILIDPELQLRADGSRVRAAESQGGRTDSKRVRLASPVAGSTSAASLPGQGNDGATV